MSAPILELDSVSWCAGQRTILHDVSLVIQAGEFVSIIGPSGAGKSSMFRLIVRFIETTSGRILFEGQDIKEIDVIQLRRQIGLLLQDSFMFEGNVRTNIVYGPKLQNMPVDEEKLLRLVSEVDLPQEILDQDASKLSGGERQRVAIVRMLMNEPKILLLDEITSALDLSNELMVESLIKEVQASLGITILMVSHDFDQARRMGGSTVFMANGTVVETGLATDMFAHPKNELTAKFLEGDLV